MFANTKPNTKKCEHNIFRKKYILLCDIQYIQWPIQSLLYQNGKKNPLERNALNSFFDIKNMIGFQMTFLFDSDLNLQMNGSLSIKNLINWSYHRSLKVDPYITSLASEQKAYTAITCIKSNPYNTYTSITSKPKAHNVVVMTLWAFVLRL